MRSTIDDLPPLREVINTHGLDARKALGQNFILDLNITTKVALTTGPLDGVTVLEIGPGPGGLTRSLLAAGAKQVIAIEKDTRCEGALEQIGSYYSGQLQTIFGDALSLDHQSILAGADEIRIIANLPYNIATPLLTNWIGGTQWPPYFSAMALMFQREVAQRITASVGDKAYGRLAILANWRFHTDIAFDLSPQVFTPPPKVTSSVVNFQPRKVIEPCSVRSLEAITRAAFGQRRKMVRQSLKGLGGAELLERAEIAGTRRAEELSISEFVALANAWDIQRRSN